LIGMFPRQWLAFLMLAVAGIGRTVADVSGRTLLQRIVPDEVLSRVFGALEGLGMAGLAVGSIAVPGLVIAIGTRWGLIVIGAFLPVVVVLTDSRLMRLEAGVRVAEREIRLARSVAF